MTLDTFLDVSMLLVDFLLTVRAAVELLWPGIHDDQLGRRLVTDPLRTFVAHSGHCACLSARATTTFTVAAALVNGRSMKRLNRLSQSLDQWIHNAITTAVVSGLPVVDCAGHPAKHPPRNPYRTPDPQAHSSVEHLPTPASPLESASPESLEKSTWRSLGTYRQSKAASSASASRRNRCAAAQSSAIPAQARKTASVRVLVKSPASKPPCRE